MRCVKAEPRWNTTQHWNQKSTELSPQNKFTKSRCGASLKDWIDCLLVYVVLCFLLFLYLFFHQESIEAVVIFLTFDITDWTEAEILLSFKNADWLHSWKNVVMNNACWRSDSAGTQGLTLTHILTKNTWMYCRQNKYSYNEACVQNLFYRDAYIAA